MKTSSTVSAYSSFRLHPSSFLEFSRRDLLDHVVLDLVADLDVVEILEADTALETFADFGGIVFESTQRRDVAFPRDYPVANKTRARVALDNAVDHHAAGHGADTRDAENLAHVGLAENLLPLDFLQHADHGGLNFFFDLVDDRMQANVDAFLFRQFIGARFRTHIEADDDDRG